MASFRPCAIREEKRKKLKETTSKTRRFLATSMPASQADRFSRLCWFGTATVSPTKTAIVKSEFTFTRPSRAVTCTLVVEGEMEPDDDTLLLSPSLQYVSFGDSAIA
uniref:Uncharacterized protein MANES_S088000 n=1 Tax=Rhizophora mucronata TaxID=61149 RepID=A0A2P2K033_RHIMU